MNENTWKQSARAWWERLNEERAKSAELLRELEQEREMRAVVREQLDEEAERAKARESELDELLQKLEELRAQPSGNPGDFAALAERIAYADGKHPRDCEDVERTKYVDSILYYARKRLAAAPTWDNALRCELAEALDALACEEMDAFADELLDVATVAMRWRRAVMERGKD